MEYWEYEALSDEQLLERNAAGDVYATELLITRYKNLVRKNAHALYLIGGDREDLIQEGMIGLYKAIRDYDKERAAGFATFANLCISRQMYTAIKASNTQKNKPLNDYLSFDAPLPEADAVSELGADLLPLRWYLQNAVYMEEENYARVAKRLDKSLKTVDNALQRIRKKLALPICG